MLALFHAPQSRSSRIVRLIDELGVQEDVEVRTVTITYNDGSGGVDAANPHPEGKVPLLVHDGVEIWESNAIILYLTDLFPAAELAPVVGDSDRGIYLSWLAYYGNVVEPVMVLDAAALSHPILDVTFRGMPELVERLQRTLERTPYLLGEAFSAADLLLISPFTWFPDKAPDVPAIRRWMERCEARPSAAAIAAADRASG